MTAIPPGYHLIVGTGASSAPIDAEWASGLNQSGQWRWSQRVRTWFGPALAASWQIGDNVGVPTGPWPGLGVATIMCSTLSSATPDASQQANIGTPQYNFNDASTSAVAATDAGTGVIFLVQTEPGVPAIPGSPPIDLDVSAYLGDVVLTNGTNVVPYDIDYGDGVDGDYFLDWNSRILYRRDIGLWTAVGNISNPLDQISVSATTAAQVVVEGFGGLNSGADPIGDADLFRFFADTGIGRYPDAGTRGRPNGTLILMGDLPDDSVLADGQMALWFDPTNGAGKFMIKAKTADGTVVTGNVPLT